MKTKVASLLVVFSFISTFCMAQEKITVEAQNTDISNNLDLKAVSTAFGESKNLEEFEKKLNDYDSQISNLDLNKDGQVDYLRVIEKNENGVHVVEIQAVLDKDVYQDVASIIVEKDQNNNPTVQVVGDPYLYGDNYIIEPSYIYTPSIFSFFWGANYFSWNSPYYWGYYPTYYHHRRPYGLNEYYSNVYSHINHNQRYYYTNSIRNTSAIGLRNSIRRNDLGVRQPSQSFSNRNVNVRNKRDFEFSRSGVNVQTRTTNQGNSTGTRPTRTFDNGGNRSSNYQNSTRTTNMNSNIRTNVDSRNSNPRTYSTPSNGQQNSGINRNQNRSYQSQPAYNSNTQTRTPNSVNSNNNSNYQQAPRVSQPRQENVQRQQQVVRQQSVSAPRSTAAPRVESSSRSQSSGNQSRSSDSNNSRGSDSNRR